MSKLKILRLLQKIPKGKVTTYKILGEKAGVHPRAVGMVLKKNKNPKCYPCYKVIASDGSLGGYNLGIQKKIKLLKKDRLEVENNKIKKYKEFICYF